MCEKVFATEAAQIFAYEVKGDSAVIWRCFSRDTKAYIPDQIAGYPVTEIVPYAFSAHMEEQALRQGIETGQVRLYVPEALGGIGVNVPTLCGDALDENGVNVRVLCRDTLDGSIGNVPALCGDALEEIVFPRTLRRVGRYCFYDCSNLRRLTFYGSMIDWGSGVFTRCHRVQEMCVYTDEQGSSSLKEVLDELPEEMLVDYYLPNESRVSTYVRARLVFPEFYEEGVENTPARILETHVHGSGMSYRNCFQGKRVEFAQYDALFERAQVLERAEIAQRISVGRLQDDVALSKRARAQYETYLWAHLQETSLALLHRRDLDGLRWLFSHLEAAAADTAAGAGIAASAEKSATADSAADRGENTAADTAADRAERRKCLQEAAVFLTQEASKMHFAEAVSYLMERGKKERVTKRKRLEL